MTIGEILSIACLAAMVVLILRGIRGHGRGGGSEGPGDSLSEFGGGD